MFFHSQPRMQWLRMTRRSLARRLGNLNSNLISVSEIISPQMDELDEEYGYQPEAGGFWGGGISEQFPESVDPFAQLGVDGRFGNRIENGDGKFAHNSIDGVADAAGVNVREWNKVAESSGGDILQKESQGREWLYKDESGERASVTGSQAIGERHQEILDSLYNVGFSISEYQKSDSDILVKEIYFADEKGNISYQVFEKQAGDREQNVLIDDGDGLEDTVDPTATGRLSDAENSPAPGLQEITASVSAEKSALQGEGLGQDSESVESQMLASEIKTLDGTDAPDLDIAPTPAGFAEDLRAVADEEENARPLVLEESLEQTAARAVDLPETIDLKESPQPAVELQPQPQNQESAPEEFENFDDVDMDLRPVPVVEVTDAPRTVVNAAESQERLFVDARGYEVPVAEAVKPGESNAPDIFELTRTEDMRDVIMPYLEERDRHLDISFSPEASNGVTTIEEPTMADIRDALDRYKEDVRNEQLYGGLTESAFEAKKRAIDLEKEEQEEQQRQQQEQNRRIEQRRIFLEDEEEEEINQALRAMKASAGEAISNTGDKEIRDRGNDRLNTVQEIRQTASRSFQTENSRTHFAVENIRTAEIQQTEEDREAQSRAEVLFIERTTGISIARTAETEETQKEQATEPELERAQRIAQNSSVQIRLVTNTNQRDEAATASVSETKSPEMRAIEAEAGIKLVFEQQKEAEPQDRPAELFVREAQTARSVAPVTPLDDTGTEPEYLTGDSALELAA